MLAKAAVVLLLLAGGVLAGEILIDPAREAVPLPGAESGLRLDDYYFDRTLDALVVPAGRNLDFIEAASTTAVPMTGFGAVTSADGAGGLVFATDRAVP